MIIRMNGAALPERIIEAEMIQEKKPIQLSEGTTNLFLGSMFAMIVPHASEPLAMPVFAHAPVAAAVATAVNTSGFFKLLDAIIAIMDPIATCVVVFAGLAWMFGHRTKSIDLLIGVAAGTLIITHAHDLVHWLRTVM